MFDIGGEAEIGKRPTESRAYPPSIQAGIPRLGPTPKGWSRIALGGLLRRVERPAQLMDDLEYQLVTAKRNRGGIVPRERLRGSQIKTKTQFFVEPGDFLISNRQISHGACGLVPRPLGGSIVSNEYSAFRTNENLLPEFLNALSHSIYFQETCFHSSIGVHVEKLVFRLDDWLEWEFDIPPVHEQRRIVAVIDTWDHAVETTGKILAATQQRKSALIRKLFANLPQRGLLSAAEVWFSGVDKKSATDEEAVLLCNYIDVFQNIKITSKINFMHATATKQEMIANRLQKHDVVFTKDSETAEEIAECALVAEDVDRLVCGYHLAIARPHDGMACGPYLAQALKHPAVRWQFSRLANGVVRYGLTLDAIEQVEIPLPSPDVQKKVAAILDAEDESITLLRNRAEALRAQRRGLVQQLLSGKWRLSSDFNRAPLKPQTPPGIEAI